MFNKRLLNYYIGLFAEFIAGLFLTIKCYRVIAKRYKCHFGELDIIATKGSRIIFIEVKKRTSHDTESISPKSAKRIYNSASYFLARNSKFTNYEMRIDLIQFNRFFVPKHFKNYITW